ncbi:hypothetical protein P5P86_06765 [Nocardioides sp. BP30]|uniref:hypothetical protein n=1 Tax=Nocardioides sp. BP30 TaxID=3036374 RepID=UPI002468EF14|nr:hypothetical protein [Nocardioides sp. BP30]WGL53529.1 hypothetical protein P5P86_06765 [Nocardioides sp. BP30]
MTDASSNDQHFGGFEHNAYQSNMHTLAMISLWLIIVAGVACGIFGFFWGLSH